MRSITLICVVAMCALAALAVCPASAAEIPTCISGERCPEGEFCVQHAEGNGPLRTCNQPAGDGETCGLRGALGIYLRYPPCEKPYNCRMESYVGRCEILTF